MVGLHHRDSRRDARIGAYHPRRGHHRSIGGSRHRFPQLGGICHIDHRGVDDGVASFENRPFRRWASNHLRRHHQLHRGFDHCARRRWARDGGQFDRYFRNLLLRSGNLASVAAESRHANSCRYSVDADRGYHTPFCSRLDAGGPRKCTIVRRHYSGRNHRVALSRVGSPRAEPLATLVDITRNNRRLHSGRIARNL